MPGSTESAKTNVLAKRQIIFRAALIFLFVSVFFAYQPAWHGQFLWDDKGHITRPELQSIEGLIRIWFEPKATQQYYPLTHTVFWLEQKIWGDATTGYHLVNIFLHAAASVLLFFILRRLELPGALMAAAVFALHPVQVESVAWISELKNTLSAVLYLAAALAYLQFDLVRGPRFYFLSLCFFVLALFSKTVVASLPAALLVIFWWKRGRLRRREDILPLVPFFVFGMAAGLFTAWVERTLIGASGSGFDFSFVERCLIAGRAIWFYAFKLLWPFHLSFIYERWSIDQTAGWQYVFPAATVLVLVLAWMMRRRWRGPLAAFLFFKGTLFPALGFFNVFPFRYSFVADHFQYLASIGIIGFVVAGSHFLLGRFLSRSRSSLNGICFVVLIFLAALTWRQARIYKDPETLWLDTLAKNPGCWLAHNSLGSDLGARGQNDQAIEHFAASLGIKPHDFSNPEDWKPLLGKNRNEEEAISHDNWGVALARKGNISAAMDHYRFSISLNPSFPNSHLNLARALADQGRLQESLAEYQAVLQLVPSSEPAHYGSAVVLERSGNMDAAIEFYSATVRLNPNHVGALNNLAYIFINKGRLDEALACSARAVALDPNFSQAHYNLGNALFLKSRLEEAAAHYERAIAIHPEYAEALGNLATVCLKLGRVPDAVKHLTRLVQLRPADESAKKRLDDARLKLSQLNEAAR